MTSVFWDFKTYDKCCANKIGFIQSAAVHLHTDRQTGMLWPFWVCLDTLISFQTQLQMNRKWAVYSGPVWRNHKWVTNKWNLTLILNAVHLGKKSLGAIIIQQFQQQLGSLFSFDSQANAGLKGKGAQTQAHTQTHRAIIRMTLHLANTHLQTQSKAI